MSKLLTSLEAAKILRVTVRTLRTWRAAGVIRAVRIGGCVRYEHAELRRLLKSTQDTPDRQGH